MSNTGGSQTPARVLVTGSRHLSAASAISAALSAALARHGTIVVVHGDGRGADALAKQWAIDNGVPHKPHPADWSLGRRAGPVRNNEMVRSGAVEALAFLDDGESRGTRGCIAACIRAGIRVRVHVVVG